jgi:hypothetical protein
MAQESVYLETSLVSYLVARPSRDLIRAARQQLTVDWWENERMKFELFVSDVVLQEASAGNPTEAAKRLAVVAGILQLQITNEAVLLAADLVKKHALPAQAVQDALHIAIACVNGVDYLLTWNCKHIANAQMRSKIEQTCRRAGYEPPVICTPEEMGESDD